MRLQTAAVVVGVGDWLHVIGRSAVRKARFASLEVDELTVRKLRVLKQGGLESPKAFP